ncbi:MAG TPA: type II secretion system F family protein [Xanthobacteraceae bacterium]
MVELWVITGFVFIAVVFGVEAVCSFVFNGARINKIIDRRLELSRSPLHATEASNALRGEHGLLDSDHPAFRNLNDLMMQTGLRPDKNVLLLGLVALSVFLFFGWALVLGHGLGAIAAAVVSAVMLMFLFFKGARQRRIARFAELLPDSIDVIVRAVRVGYPLPLALDLVAREMPDPVGAEFKAACDEITFGQDMRTAIENLYRRVGQEDLLFLVVAINVQYQTGGNLAEILSRLSRLIRHRARLRLKISALSAEGRASALVLSLMPFILFGGISLISPGYFGEVRDHPLVAPALIYAAISLLIGNVVMHRMVNFKF